MVDMEDTGPAPGAGSDIPAEAVDSTAAGTGEGAPGDIAGNKAEDTAVVADDNKANCAIASSERSVGHPDGPWPRPR